MDTRNAFLGLAMSFVLSTSVFAAQTRLVHAKELLGGTYKRSVVRKSEKEIDISEFVKETTRKFLPKGFRKSSEKIAEALLDAADEYGLDPVFLMAVVQNESSFRPRMKGPFGEIGLMQLKPATAAWISKLYKIDCYKGEKSLYDPVTNIELGAALIDKLRHQFEAHSRLYVSAYNIGAKKVRALVSGKKTPKEYVQAVMKRYIAIYSAFKVEGDSKRRSEVAFMNTKNLTKPKQATAEAPSSNL